MIIAGAGHVLTLIAALMVFLRRRGAGDRAAKKQRRQRNKALQQALLSARSAPISQIAPALSAALKDWERQSGVSVKDLIGRIETEAYSPQAVSECCSEELLRDIEARIEPAPTLTSGSVASLLLCGMLLILGCGCS